MTETDTAHNSIRLAGCSPTPLAHYLKGLGLLRLVDEQADDEVRGWWQDDDFVLQTSLDRDALVDFLLEDYAPTPIAAPWNAGSGIKGDTLKDDWKVILEGQGERFARLRDVVKRSRSLMDAMGIEGKVPKKRKEDYLRACRGRWSDDALEWLDAVLVLTGEGPKYPPILGTGGNDGRLDFTINFAARLQKLFDPSNGAPRPDAPDWLEASLFDRADSHMDDDGAIGQFFPSAAGGPNQSSGFATDTLLNPWDYVLMLEGAVMFASAAVKRMGVTEKGALSVPFCVHHVGVGHGSSATAEEDNAHPEMWLPLWERPASADELHALMAEGRAEIAGRPARDGVDFARAVATLGVDRGISSFQRVGFQERNGQSYFATPLNRVAVRRQAEADLLADIDGWLDTFLSRAKDDEAPGSVQSAARRLQSAIFELCQHGGRRCVTDVLVELGNCERAMARSFGWSTESYVKPLSGLSGEWLRQGNDGTVEYRLAASLASLWNWIRPNLEPIAFYGTNRIDWAEQVGPDVVWHPGDAVEVLNDVMRRRLIDVQRSDADSWSDRSTIPARAADIAAFIDGRVDTRRMMKLLWGLAPVDFTDVDVGPLASPQTEDRRRETAPGAFYALLKLCFSEPLPGQDEAVPVVPKIHRLAAAEDGRRAAELAWRRLRGSGLAPVVRRFAVTDERARRTAAALLFPVWSSDLESLAKLVLEPEALPDPPTMARSVS